MAGITRRELVLGLAALPLAACASGEDEPVRFAAGPSAGLSRPGLGGAGARVGPTRLRAGLGPRPARPLGGLHVRAEVGRCNVRWIPSTRRFVCPCHGTVYGPDGTEQAGPAREPLRGREAIAEDGTIYVGLEARGSRVDPLLMR